MFISFQKILVVEIALSEILRLKNGQKTLKIGQIAHSPENDLFLNTVPGRGALEVSPERNIFLAPARFQNLSWSHQKNAFFGHFSSFLGLFRHFLTRFSPLKSLKLKEIISKFRVLPT